MIKQLQKIGRSRGIILEKSILDLLNIDENASFEITPEKGGLFLKPISVKEAYKYISQKHRESLNKLSE